jgi:hypothetical protein
MKVRRPRRQSLALRMLDALRDQLMEPGLVADRSR